MFATAFTSLAGYFERRFMLTIWLPMLLFWSALLALVVAAFGWRVTITWWNGQPTEVRFLAGLLLLAWITLCAYLLAAQLGSLLRLYEGYWQGLPGGARLAERRRAHYLRRMTELYTASQGSGREAGSAYARIYLCYPSYSYREQVMPTRLGNILKSSEVHSWHRYRLDAVLVWPRLYGVLPERAAKGVSVAKADLDLMLSVSALGAGFAVLGGAVAVVLLPWWAAPLCVWGGALVAWAGYRGALGNAVPYAQLVKAAFDVHRRTLLTEIGWSTPTSWAAERAQWEQIGHLWYRGAPEDPGPLGYPMAPPEFGDDD